MQKILPEVGAVFEDRYEILSLLGKGGFAVVYRARDRDMQRDVALKILMPGDGAKGDLASARFLREAKILSALAHPNIVKLFDFGESSAGLRYIVFEYVSGRDLAAVLSSDGALAPEHVIHILIQILDALNEAHGHGLLHRDVKPGNVLVHSYYDDHFRAKLLDFGVAKLTGEEPSQQLTRTGRVVGTLRYMAPEQLCGEPLDGRADIYALGLIGYEMLTGRPAIEGSSQRTLVSEQLSPAPLSLPQPIQHDLLRHVLERAMAREPHDRWPTAAAMRDALLGADIAEPTAPVVKRADARQRKPPAQAPPARARSLAPLIIGSGVGAALMFFAITRPTQPKPASTVNVERLARVAQTSEPVPVSHASSVDAATPDSAEFDMESDAGTRSACGRPPPSSYDGRLALGWPGGPVAAHIPAGYDGKTPLPIVLMFHRNWHKGSNLLDVSGLKRIADEERFFVLAPNSTTTIGFEPNDPSAILTLLDEAERQLCIDRSRLYLIGDHAGEGVVREFMCKVPVSAYAVTMSGSGRACTPVVKTPRLRIYGLQSKDVPVEGGRGCHPLVGQLPSAASMSRNWRKELRCGPRPSRWKEGLPGGDCQIWRCEHGDYVECATDGGHQWPGQTAFMPIEACRTVPPEVDFPMGEVIWMFFREHGRPVSEVPLAERESDLP